MSYEKYLDTSPEVAEAIRNKKPVVALESTIISHGMPYPQNVETALQVEQIIRDNGAVPATIAIINGRLKVGLTPEQLEYFGKKGTAIAKVSRRDIPIALLVTFLFAAFALTGQKIAFWEGVAFLLIFVAYMVYCFKTDQGADEAAEEKVKSLGLAMVLVVIGLAGLVFGGQLFVNNATSIARAVGVSDKFIAITLLAGGTSFPELATCIVAAAKKKDQLALGNVLGSNVFNILLILGTSSLVLPISTFALTWVDLGVLLLSVILVWLWAYTGKRDRIDRWEAILMLLLFFGYYGWLFVKL